MYVVRVGANDGSIIAAIITTQLAVNQPSEPRSVLGLAFIPAIRSAVHHHASAAAATSTAIASGRLRDTCSGVTTRLRGHARTRRGGAATTPRSSSRHDLSAFGP